MENYRKEDLLMNEPINFAALIEVLGSDNVELIKKEIARLLLEKIENDLNPDGEYLVHPVDLEGIVQEILAEIRAEVKEIIKARVMKQMEGKLESLLVS